MPVLINKAFVDNVRKLAHEAWLEGDQFFTPTLGSPIKAPVGGRVLEWPAMLAAITDEGWSLHTWCVAGDKNDPLALPLFTR